MRTIFTLLKKALILICLFSLGIVPLNEIYGQTKISGIIGEQPDKNIVKTPVELLSPWTVGTAKPKVEGSNRVLVVTVNGKTNNMNESKDLALTYGGIPMTLQIKDMEGTTGFGNYSFIFTLDEAGIAAADPAGEIEATWTNRAPSLPYDILSAFYENVDQTTPVKGKSSAAATALEVEATALSADAGDLVLMSASFPNTPRTPGYPTGFSEIINTGSRETTQATHIVAFKNGDGTDVIPSITTSHTSAERIVITAIVLQQGEGEEEDKMFYTLTVHPAEGGTIEVEPLRIRYEAGEGVVLKATPHEGYRFVGWEGDHITQANPTSVVMNSDKVITAVFAFSGFAGTISIFYNFAIPQQEFAVNDIKTALEAISHTVEIKDISTLTENFEKKKIVIALASNTEISALLANEGGSTVGTLGEQAYALRTTTTPQMSYWVLGGDNNGAMYGGLEIAENIKFNGFKETYSSQQSPSILKRGIKLNLPFDEKSPTYESNSRGTSYQNAIPHIWDISFWEEWFDEMARHRYNVVSVWNNHPFTSLVLLPEYPDLAIQDVTGFDGYTKKMSIHEKIDFWRQVMKLAHARGFEFLFFNWNVWVANANGKYGLANAETSDANKEYMYKSMMKLLETYPDLDGFGVTNGENKSNQDFLWAAYGKAMYDYAVKNPHRKLRFIHRWHQTSLGNIRQTFSGLFDLPNVTFEMSYKYSKAHMYSTPVPKHFDKWNHSNQLVDNNMKTWFTVRNDSFYYHTWGDPSFARIYINGMLDYGKHFAGFYMGSDGFCPTRTFFCKTPVSQGILEVQRQWYMNMIWGRLAYNPQTPDAVFKNYMKLRYPTISPDKLFTAWSKASSGIQRTNELIHEDFAVDFKWYPEACMTVWGFATVDLFGEADVGPGSSLCNIQNSAAGKCDGKKSSYQLADEIETDALSALKTVSAMRAKPNTEQWVAINNIKAMSYLSLYYAHKIRGATFKLAGKDSKTITSLGKAYCWWINYSNLMNMMYYGQANQRTRPVLPDWHFLDAIVLKEYTDLGGPANFDCSNPYPWVNIISPVGGDNFMEPADITVEVIGDASDNPTEKVELRINNILIDTSYESPFNFDLDSLLLGEYKLEARVYDDQGTSVSDSIRIRVHDSNTFNGIPWIEDFTLPDGTKSNDGHTAWTSARSRGSFEVQNNRFVVNGDGPEGVFQSGIINISGQPVTVSLDAAYQGGIDNGQDYVKFYIKVDQRQEELIGIFDGKRFQGVELKDSEFITMKKDGIVGNILQLIIKGYVTFSDEFYLIDNLSVTYSEGSENQPPQINIASPLNNAEFDQYSSIKFEMVASDPDGTINRVELRANGTLVSILKEEPYSVILSNLKPGNNHIVASAFDNKGASANSAINILINPISRLNQYITFPDLPIVHIGDADFDPGAISSSGYMVSYRSSNTNVATIRDEKIQIVGVGIAIITATQAGDSKYYYPAQEVSKVLNVRDNTSSGIDGSSSQIIIHPNPANKVVYINAPNNYSFSLINMNGIEVLQESNLHGTTQIELTNFSKGIYFFKIIQHEHLNIKKLIIN